MVVPSATWLLHQPIKCCNSICHCGNNISHPYVTFHLSQLKFHQLPQTSCFHQPLKHDVTITSVTIGINHQPSNHMAITSAKTSVVTNSMTITSVTKNIQLTYHLSTTNQKILWQKYPKIL